MLVKDQAVAVLVRLTLNHGLYITRDVTHAAAPIWSWALSLY